MWGGVHEFVKLTLEGNARYKESDHCLNFILDLSGTILKEEDTALVGILTQNYPKLPKLRKFNSC